METGPGGDPDDAAEPADLADVDDTALLAAHAAGRRGAFDVLVRRHGDRMWAVALATCRDPDDASDALQEALLRVHRAAGSFRGESAVTTWLHRIVVNAGRDLLRRRAARPTVALPEKFDPAAPGDSVAAGVAGLVVHQALEQLAAEQRATLVLVDLLGVSVAETAQLLEVAEGTVKSRCARGRARLAVLLGVLDPAGRSDDIGGTPGPPATSNRPTAHTAPSPRPPTTPSSQQPPADEPQGHRHEPGDAP